MALNLVVDISSWHIFITKNYFKKRSLQTRMLILNDLDRHDSFVLLFMFGDFWVPEAKCNYHLFSRYKSPRSSIYRSLVVLETWKKNTLMYGLTDSTSRSYKLMTVRLPYCSMIAAQSLLHFRTVTLSNVYMRLH